MSYLFRRQDHHTAGSKTPSPLLDWLQNTPGKRGTGSIPQATRANSIGHTSFRDESDPIACRAVSPADSGIEIVDRSLCLNAYASVPPSVLEARKNAKYVLNNCRATLLALELTRMRKSRIGMSSWVAFWHRIYDPELARAICATIVRVAPKIDKVFRSIAKELFDLSYKIGADIERATTDAQIIRCWQLMEQETVAYRNLRERYVTAILEDLRLSIEAIPVDISDDLFNDLKRAIFVVDPTGNYHPGDPEAEERDILSLTRPEAREYVRADPQLILRPGFSSDFRSALEQAAAEQLELVNEDELEPQALELCPSYETATTGEWSEEVLSEMGIEITP
ncbi:hypothetical protein GX48_01670 [Paracoccidioides brasiliensis]|nr:hypothetical protein GX48_01670 [Paracoccidioides brasiliensis]